MDNRPTIAQRTRELTEDTAVHVLRLNRPERLNALDGALHEAIAAALTAAGEDMAVYTLVLTRTGRAYCIGVDLHGGAIPSSLGHSIGRNGHPLLRPMRALPKPIVHA